MPALLIAISVVAYAALSAVAFATFTFDKQCARLGTRRVPERTLHTLTLLGGFPGSLAAMALVRHKNRKVGFVFITFLAAAAHIALWTLVLLLWLHHR